MLAAVAIGLVVRWLTPVSFGLHAPGWHVGRSGTYYESVGKAHSPTSTAWAANVRCPDCGRSNPPNETIRRLPARGIIVRAYIEPPDSTGWPPAERRLTRAYSLADASRFPCCEAARVAGGLWELYGFGPKRTYGVVVDIYWGSRPDTAMQAGAQRAIRSLHLPRAR